jgi:putative flippase GtrA
VADLKPQPKVAAGGIGGAAALVIIWVAGLLGLDVPAEVAAAIVGLVSFGVAYFVPQRPV